MSEQWLDYRQLGELWQMSPKAARTRARRGRFPRRVGNQGQAEVLVDTDAPVRRPRPPRAAGQSQTTTTTPAPDAESPSAVTLKALEALQGHIDTLKAELAKAEALAADRGQEAAAAREQVATLTSQMLRITADLAEARKAEATRPRSWWARLTGTRG
jgi:hypothetical protein